MLLALILASVPLTEANKAYADLEYETCVSRLAGLKGIPAGERARAELLLGLCHFALGHERQAAAAIENALRRDSSVSAPSNASPKEVAFIDSQRAAASVKKKTVVASVKKDEPEAPPPVVDAPVAEPPPAEVVETKPVVAEPPPAAVEAALPPKTPEVVVQKATWLPFVMGGVALAAAGVGTGLGVNASSLEAQGRAEPVQIDSARLATNAQTSATGANIAFAVAGTAAVTTIVAFILTR
ncbi:MAG: hypothetical protein JNM17_14015 [Archangium sp.]|nr:hypothetical protein [Archangium sp.]